MYASASVAGYAMILARHVAIIRARPTSMRLYDQAKACMKMKDQVMRRWLLHGNVSRKGYGNTLIGRSGGCFKERYNDAYDDRAYHAKDLDAPTKFATTLKMVKGNARYGRV